MRSRWTVPGSARQAQDNQPYCWSALLWLAMLSACTLCSRARCPPAYEQGVLVGRNTLQAAWVDEQTQGCTTYALKSALTSAGVCARINSFESEGAQRRSLLASCLQLEHRQVNMMTASHAWDLVRCLQDLSTDQYCDCSIQTVPELRPD